MATLDSNRYSEWNRHREWQWTYHYQHLYSRRSGLQLKAHKKLGWEPALREDNKFTFTLTGPEEIDQKDQANQAKKTDQTKENNLNGERSL